MGFEFSWLGGCPANGQLHCEPDPQVVEYPPFRRVGFYPIENRFREGDSESTRSHEMDGDRDDISHVALDRLPTPRLLANSESYETTNKTPLVHSSHTGPLLPCHNLLQYRQGDRQGCRSCW